MPVVAPIMKIQSCRSMGAQVLIQGQNMAETKQYALKKSKEENKIYING